MKLIDKYIVKNLILAVLVVVLLVVGIDICITFMVEQGDVGKGNFTSLNAFIFAILNVPTHILVGFPVICLVGIVMGLSLLNHNNEIVIIRTNGYSLLKITTIAVITTFFMSLVMLGISEWVAPLAKQTAEINKAVAKSGGQALKNKHGVWLRAAGDFVHIDKILFDGELEGITKYQVEDSELKAVIYAKKAKHINGSWYAYDVKKSIINNQAGNKVTSYEEKQEEWVKFLKPDFLKVVTVDPEDLSLTGLYKYIKYRKENGLFYEQYQLVFWQKLMQPLTVMVMVFLAVPFVFSSVRSTAVSKRLVLSILIGVSYFLLDKVLVSVVQFFGMPVIFGAFGPALCFILLACWHLGYQLRYMPFLVSQKKI